MEQYHVVSGSGVFHDNGEEKPIAAGETGVIRPDQYHGLKNTGGTVLEVIAVHIFR